MVPYFSSPFGTRLSPVMTTPSGSVLWPSRAASNASDELPMRVATAQAHTIMTTLLSSWIKMRI